MNFQVSVLQIRSAAVRMKFVFYSVAEGVTAINQATDASDERLLMAALKYPRASIYGVTSQCSQQYLVELTKLKDKKKQPGWWSSCYTVTLHLLTVPN